MKLPKISGIFFQKEGKEEGYRGISHADFADYADFDLLGLGFRKSSSLFFLVPTDFTDAHRFLTYSVISETGGCLWVLMGANPPGVQADL